MKPLKPSEQKPVEPQSVLPAAAAHSKPAAPEFTERQKRIAQWLPLWVCAGFLLFANLGVAAVYGSEGRWLVIVREMFQTGDFLHPTINFEPYFDKPLLSYWLAAFFSHFNHDTVTELTARLPSVIAAFAALGATAVMVRTLWNSATALLACWIFMTFYSFAMWGRLAEADMVNLAFSTAAAAWYLAHRKEKSFTGYLGFFLICFIGAHAKGLTCVAVPFIAAAVDMILNKRFRMHLNWKSVLAFAVGIGVYLIPFWLSRTIPPAIAPELQNVVDSDGTIKTSGIALALRENVIRYFAPFDHKEPFYAYLIHVPRLTIPWTPILILAIIHAVRSRKSFGESEKWLCWTMIAIFLFFSVSGSKRHYYILPLMPYCAALCAWYFFRDIRGREGLVRALVTAVYRWFPPCAMLTAFFLLVLAVLFPSLVPSPLDPMRRMIPQTMMTLLAGTFVIGIFWFRISTGENPFTKGVPETLARSVFTTYILLLVVFIYFQPAANQFRSEKHALQSMAKILKEAKIPKENIFFYDRAFINGVLYLDLGFKIPVLEKPADVEALIRKRPGERIFIISQERFFKRLSPELLKRMPRVVSEYVFPWERRRKSSSGKKYVMRVLKTGTEKSSGSRISDPAQSKRGKG